MIGQPLGCILALVIALLSAAIAAAVIAPIRSALGWGSVAFIWTPVVAVIPFSLLLDLGHRSEIRYFFKKRGVKIARIRGFRNHYRVDYLRDGKKLSGKWPKDFESWTAMSAP